MSPLNPILPPAGAAPIVPEAPVSSTGKPEVPFAETLSRMFAETNDAQKNVFNSVQQLATGQSDSVQDVVLAAAKADLAFRFVLEVRNKLVDTYQEIMRMQV